MLIILDCCFAANGAKGAGNGTNEIITACSSESVTTGVSRDSFTQVVTRELETLAHGFHTKGVRFTAVTLHSAIVRYSRDLKFTPFYARLTDHECQSIELSPLPQRAPTQPRPIPGSFPVYPPAPGVTAPSVTAPAVCAKVLLAIHVSEAPDSRLISYLRGEPNAIVPEYLADINVLKVEAVYQSHSTLLLVSVPVQVWDLLPDDPACHFVGFVTSSNMLSVHSPRVHIKPKAPASDLSTSRQWLTFLCDSPKLLGARLLNSLPEVLEGYGRSASQEAPCETQLASGELALRDTPLVIIGAGMLAQRIVEYIEPRSQCPITLVSTTVSLTRCTGMSQAIRSQMYSRNQSFTPKVGPSK